MKKFDGLGRSLTKGEQKTITGGVLDPGGGGTTCGVVCYNCVALSVRCKDPGVCMCTSFGCTCPDGSQHPCPDGNYCS